MQTKPGERRNLLLLTIDAWRADSVDEYAGIPLTPTLHALRERTLRFSHAYATAPWTSPAIISILTGQSALEHGVHYEWDAPRPGGPALPALLAQAGYQTPNLCYLNRVGNYHHLGYDPQAAPGYPESPDDDLLPRTLRALAAGPAQPFFLWYHYKFVHLPYWPHERYRRLFGVDDAAVPARVRDSVGRLFVVPRQQYPLLAADRAVVRALYAGAVRQMDDFLGRVFAVLEATAQLERTTVVLTADHGEELLEHGHVGHASTSHHATLYEEVLRVPLLFIDARIQGPRTVAARVQGQDLFPTLLGLGGAALRQPAGGPAVDLGGLIVDPAAPLPAGLTADRVLAFQSARMGYQTPASHSAQVIWGFSDGRRKYIYEHYEAPRQLLYDLASDPGEQAPRTHGPEVAAAHAELLARRKAAGQ
ncbi:MAG TPA: sulfatase [Pseudomonadota bacterium]|nr:sulfatase [Pseudomonadota bacterium]